MKDTPEQILGESSEKNLGTTPFVDGTVVFADACKQFNVDVLNLIVHTAKWVHPDTFRYLPLWYPEYWRGARRYNATWTKGSHNNKRDQPKHEANEHAQIALKRALGIFNQKLWPNWTCCHIWAVDDPKFQRINTVVKDSKYYSCVGNMVLLPSPLKALTDSLPEVKTLLRVCAWNLYGWTCDHPDVKKEADLIKKGVVPKDYPKAWPLPSRPGVPPGTIAMTPRIKAAAFKRLTDIRQDCASDSYPHFPMNNVLDTILYWERFMGKTIYSSKDITPT